MVCDPPINDEKVYIAEPFVSERAGLCVAPSTTIVNVPVGVVVLELDPDATVIVTASLAPAATVLVDADNVVFDATNPAAITVKLSDPLDAMYVVLPEYAAVMVCEPTTAEENVYVADPFTKVSAGVCIVPSTVIVTLPVGVAMLELDPEATVMVIASFAPAFGVVAAAESVVLEATAVTLTVTEPVEAR